MSSGLPRQTSGFRFPPGMWPEASRRHLHFQRSETGQGWHWRQRIHRQLESTSSALNPATIGLRSPKLARLEAALFVADSALSPRKLAQVAMLADYKEALQLIETLNERLDDSGAAFRVERVAAGFKLLTRPHLSVWLDRVHSRQAHIKISPPAMETLTIIAYRQPCTRADVEAIRGVQAAEMIKQLMDRNLVKIVGEDDSLGRPYLYGTTRLFLESFGLSSLNDLPMSDLLKPQTVAEEHSDETSSEASATAEHASDEQIAA